MGGSLVLIKVEVFFKLLPGRLQQKMQNIAVAIKQLVQKFSQISFNHLVNWLACHKFYTV